LPLDKLRLENMTQATEGGAASQERGHSSQEMEVDTTGKISPKKGIWDFLA